MKYLNLTILGILLSVSIKAQQLPVINLFADNMSILNAAAVSSEYMKNQYSMQAGLIYRTQWVGLEGAPKTQTLMINKLFRSRSSFDLSLGGYIVNDQVGPVGTTGVHGRVSSVLGTGKLEDGIFSVGLNLGINQYRIDFSQINFAESEFIDQRNTSFIYPDVGVGVFYARELEFGIFDGDIFYASASVPQMFALRLKYQDDVTQKSYSISRTRHYYANMGLIKYYDSDRYFEIGTWVKYLKGSVFHIDLIGKFKMNESFWIGAGISSNKSFSVESGTYLYDILGNDTGLKISYSFINYFQENSVYLNVSHEVSIQYLLHQGRRKNSWN
jgi:type IX secretion system PorP/SprF family membrane protein